IIPKFGDDATNAQTKTVLLMMVGGGGRGRGIHGAHMRPGVTIRYWPGDESRQTIPRVEYNDRGKTTVYTAADAKPEVLKNLKEERTMDCVDCHNRPTHTYELPDPAINKSIATGEISGALPFVKKKGMELLKASYSSNAEAAQRIPAGLEQYYRENYASLYEERKSEIARAGKALSAIYNRNVFPAMKVVWGSYPNNLGHTDFPGCFRCHDDNHASAGGAAKITQDCNSCHKLLAMDEANPKVLSDLGVQ
ncbi:MAG: cytochrome C, partial [Acidobacteria bacterium]|nr:cytochrome C [Acidobacteriota bacterium]